jgi:D-3-phosphoglycerate dehydrogenase
MPKNETPLVVLAGPIHHDGKALLETQARVIVCHDETEAGLVAAAREAQGILFRIKPPCTESLMAACPQLKVVGRYGVGLDTVDLPAATRLGICVVHAPAPTRTPWPNTRSC